MVIKENSFFLKFKLEHDMIGEDAPVTLETLKSHLLSVRDNMKAEYDDIIKNAIDEITLISINKSHDFSDFYFQDFEFFNQWAIGKIESAQVYNTLALMAPNFEQAVRQRLTKKILKFKDTCNPNFFYTHEALARALVQINNDVVERYKRYMKFSLKYFERLKKLDESQIKVVCGQVYHDTKSITRYEMSLNRAIKYIKYDLKDFSDKYSVNETMVFCEKRKLGIVAEKEITEWFLAPESYIKILTKECGVYSAMYIGKQRELLESLMKEPA